MEFEQLIFYIILNNLSATPGLITGTGVRGRGTEMINVLLADRLSWLYVLV